MAKTAEEILKAHTLVVDGWVQGRDELAINAMREYAAQEVEAYKERLKARIRELSDKNIALEIWENQTVNIIDAVK